MRPRALVPVALLLVPACFGGNADVTEAGKSRPQVTVDFPATALPGSTQQAVFEISNPGPGDMNGISIAFARLGVPSLPQPLVDTGTKKKSEAVESVDPEPVNVSSDAVVYYFDGLAEGESATITFDLIMPTEPGPAGNSVIVADQDEIDRARGVRLLTEVER